MALTVFLDLGNFSSKYAFRNKDGEIVVGSFSSIVHRFKNMENLNDLTRIIFNNNDYFLGKGVKNFYLGKEHLMYKGNTRKGHAEGEIRLVNALYEIYKVTKEKAFNIVITSPYKSNATDKEYFEKLKKIHTAYIDSNSFDFEIKNVVVAAEGLGALHFSSKKNCVIVDAGSMTLNVLQIYGGSISKDESTSDVGGTNFVSIPVLADEFSKACPHISYDFPIVTTGGKSKELALAIGSLGYSDVISAESEGYENYYINCLGLLLEYEEMFKELFE